MIISKILFVVLFIVIFVHLYACGKQKDTLRKLTKCLNVALLLLWYLTSQNHPSTGLIIALAASCLGDFFLIWDDMNRFVMGGVCFITAQLIYIFTYSRNISLSGYSAVLFILVCIGYAFAVLMDFFHLDGKLERKLLVPTCLYLGVNGAMNCAAFGQMLTCPGLGSLMVFIGAVCFFVSDVILFDFNFNKEYRFKTHFMIMLTYLTAQTLIIFGLTAI